MTKYKKGILAAVIVAAIASASTIKVWSTGEYITAANLNSNFAHIHGLMVGGHGPRLVNADVSGSAQIAHSKLATPALLPKAWVYASACNTSPCTISDSSGVSSVTRADAGVYSVNLTTTRSSVFYGTLVTAVGPTLASCQAGTPTTTTTPVYCHGVDGGAYADSAFTYLLMDTEN